MIEINATTKKEISVPDKEMATHTKKNKKRLLPDFFYIRWELELLSAFLAILFLIELPDWINMITHLMWDSYGATINTYWVVIVADILIICFTGYIIARLVWICLIRTRSSLPTERLNFTGILDEAAELLITICMIVLILALLIFMIELLIVLLKNEIIKSGDGFRMKRSS